MSIYFEGSAGGYVHGSALNDSNVLPVAAGLRLTPTADREQP